MEQRNQRLIDEINKLIKNILSKYGEVYLPSVGSLKVVEGKTQRAYNLKFSTKECDHSIVNVISKRGNCTPQQAEQVYNKWLAEVKVGESIVISGIGVIEGDNFSSYEEVSERVAQVESQPTPEPESAPAPVPTKEEKPKGGSSKIILSLLAVAIVAVVVVISMRGKGDEVVTPIEVEEDVVIAATPLEPATPITPNVEEVLPEQKEELPKGLKTKAKLTSANEALAHFESVAASNESSKNYRVVCSVLKSKVNAGRLLLDIENIAGNDATITPRIYPRNGGYMVTLYEADTFKECAKFIEANGDRFYPSMWVFDKKRM